MSQGSQTQLMTPVPANCPDQNAPAAVTLKPDGSGPTIALTDLGPDAPAPILTHSYFCNEHTSPE